MWGKQWSHQIWNGSIGKRIKTMIIDDFEESDDVFQVWMVILGKQYCESDDVIQTGYGNVGTTAQTEDWWWSSSMKY